MYVLEVKIQILEEKNKKQNKKDKQRYRAKVSKFLEDYNLF